MDKKENTRSCINVYTASISNGLKVSSADIKQVISATNNRAQLYAEQSKKYRDEAKQHRDDAKYYAEQNSDVTFDYINNVQSNLEQKIATKQPIGDYALKEEIPINVSELANDANYVNNITLENSINEIRLPEQSEQWGKFLKTDGENPYWASVNAFNLFDTKLSDKILTYEESQGWALQGTFVYKEALAGSRYGYPDFYNKVVEEFNEATATETINGVTVKVHSNGHKFYDIADKTAIDNSFNSLGYAWYYGVDTENERVFLPRNNYLTSYISNGDKSVSVYGNGLTLGVMGKKDSGDKYNAGLATYGDMISPFLGSYGTNYGTSRAGSIQQSKQTIGLTDDASKSGITGKINLQNSQNGMYLYICVGNTTNYEGVTDVVNQGVEILEQVNQGISEISQTIDTRVNLDATNLSNNGKILISSYSMPSNKYINLTLGASGTIYTAPANGYFFVDKQRGSGDYILGYNYYTGITYFSTSSVYPGRICIPCNKGNIIVIEYNLTGSTSVFRFVYAQGEV